MKIYLDIIFIINFIFDFLILISVSLILKRNTKLLKLLLGALIGSLSIFILFIKINSLTLFIFKVFISIIMILITFGFKNFIKNFLYLYLISIILGGFLIFINNMFSYKVEGLIFINKGFSLNLIIILILTPIILYIYYKENIKYKNTYSNIHQIELIYNNKKYKYSGYLDTANTLKDFLKRPVTILYDPKIKINKYFYIPYNTLNEQGLLKGIKADLIIDKKLIFKNQIIGITNKEFNLEGTNVILNKSFIRHIS